jgi:hypothetical protein
MRHISSHHDIILFYYSYSINVLTILIIFLNYLVLCPLRNHLLIIVILLSLYYITTKHLRILDLDLRIIENEIVIIYILYNLYRLVLVFFFGFWRTTSSDMRTIYIYPLIYPHNITVNILTIILLLILFISLI